MSDGDERKDEQGREEPGHEEPGHEGEATENGPAGEVSDESSAAASLESASASPEDADSGADTPVRDEEPRAAPRASRPAPRQGRRTAPAKAPAKGTMQRTVAWAAVALVLGAAGGWFAREARAHELLNSAMGRGAPATEGGSCRAWETQICDSLGAEAFACQEAKSAAGLLPTAACDEALEAVPDTLAKLKEARQGCDSLVSKLCADLGAETQTCQMVKEKTPSFPPDRCDAMLEQYDQVIGQLRMMEQAQAGMGHGMGAPGMGAPGMGGPHGGPQMGNPHGADPHGHDSHGAAPATPAPAAP